MLTQSQKDWNVKLIEALRSGKYEQTQGTLRRVIEHDGKPPGFCCLGVACDISGLGAWVERDEYGPGDEGAMLFKPTHAGPEYALRTPAVSFPTRNVIELFGFGDSGGHRIPNPKQEDTHALMFGLNDSYNLSFAEIADSLEKWLDKQEITQEAVCQ